MMDRRVAAALMGASLVSCGGMESLADRGGRPRLEFLSTVTSDDPGKAYRGLLNYPNSFRVVGNRTYVASFESDSLTVFGMEDRSKPVFLGSVSGGGPPNYLGGAHDVAVVKDLAYVVSMEYGGEDALSIFDVSEPANMRNIGHYKDSGPHRYLWNPFSIVVTGGLAYVASHGETSALGGGGRLTVFDVSDPSRPRVLSSTTDGITSALYLLKEGDLLYVSSRRDPYSGLGIYDVSNPADVRRIGGIYGLGAGNGVWTFGKQGDLIFAPELETDQVEIVDVRVPSSPIVVGRIRRPGFLRAHGAVPLGDRLFVIWELQSGHSDTYPTGALDVFDISDLSRIVEVAAIDRVSRPETKLWEPHALRILDGAIYVLGKNDDSLSLFAFKEE